MASEIRVNRLSNRSGLSTITFANGGVQFSGITTFANGDFRVGTGATILNPSTNEMQFHTGGSNRLTINNEGINLGIGSITVGDATFTGSVSIGKTLTYEDVKNVDSVGVVTARTGVKITGGDFTVGTAITASSVTGNVTNDVGITTYSGSAVWFKGATANKDMYWSHASGATVYKDNAQILMGDSSDLQIFHAGGTANKIKSGANTLYIAADDLQITNKEITEPCLKTFADGAVELYYNNSKKIETTTSGVSITGNVLPEANNTRSIGDGSTNFNSIWASTRFRGNDNVKLVLGNSQNLVIRHDGSNNIIGSPVADDLHIKSGTGDNDSNFCAKFIHGGTVELYHNNSLKFATTSSGVTVTGDMNISDGTGQSHYQITQTNGNTVKFGIVSGSDIELSGSSNNSMYFKTNNTERLRIDSSGNLWLKSSSNNQQPKLRVESYGEYGEIKADGNGSIIIDADPNFNANNSYIGFSVDGSQRGKIASNGSTTWGPSSATQSNMQWSTDTNQIPHFFWGGPAGSGQPTDGCVVIGSPQTDICSQRVGTILFGSTTSGGSGNTGLKAGINCVTNASPGSDFNAGGNLIFQTKPNNSTIVERFRIDSNGHLIPATNNAYDLGSTAKGWRNVYTNDLNLSNLPSPGNDSAGNPYTRPGNDVDGTNGSWTIQEGKDDLYIINRVNGKKYKFNLTEVS